MQQDIIADPNSEGMLTATPNTPSTTVYVKFPTHFKYLTQYGSSRTSSNPSPARSISAVVTMNAQIAAPGRWIPDVLEPELYTDFMKSLATTPSETTIALASAWLTEQGLPWVDLQHLVDSNLDELRQTVERMNGMNISQIIVLDDASKLVNAALGKPLHFWLDGNEKASEHVLMRVGYTAQGTGAYFDPAVPMLSQPLALSWKESIVPAGIKACIAVLPNGVAQPPQDFDWLHEEWPVVVPQPNMHHVQENLLAAQATLADLEQSVLALKPAIAATLAEATRGGKA